MKYITTAILLSLLFPLQGHTQIDLNNDFTALAEQMGLDFMAPLDAGYKDLKPYPNRYQVYEFAIRSRKEKLEIRYHLEPEKEGNALSSLPHVRCMQLLSHLASNDEEHNIAAHSLPTSIRVEDLNADWAKVFFFSPKKEFSPRLTCQLLAIYKEGRGMAFAFLLFDKPPVSLDNRLLTLRFEEMAENQPKAFRQ